MRRARSDAVRLPASEMRRSDGWRLKLRRCGGAAPYIDWIRDRGSLTARLEACGSFRVQLLKKVQAAPNRDEAALLGLPARSRVQVREVVLHCDGVPVVFAHTVLPLRPRGVLGRWLSRLGSRSLGKLLFTHPGFVRGLIEARRIDRRHPLHAPTVSALGCGDANCWARRSLFRFRGQRVLVTEVFGPAVRRLCAQRPGRGQG